MSNLPQNGTGGGGGTSFIKSEIDFQRLVSLLIITLWLDSRIYLLEFPFISLDLAWIMRLKFSDTNQFNIEKQEIISLKSHVLLDADHSLFQLLN